MNDEERIKEILRKKEKWVEEYDKKIERKKQKYDPNHYKPL